MVDSEAATVVALAFMAYVYSTDKNKRPEIPTPDGYMKYNEPPQAKKSAQERRTRVEEVRDIAQARENVYLHEQKAPVTAGLKPVSYARTRLLGDWKGVSYQYENPEEYNMLGIHQKTLDTITGRIGDWWDPDSDL